MPKRLSGRNHLLEKEKAVQALAPQNVNSWILSAFTRKAEYPACNCPTCGQKLWSHGYRDRHLENTKIVLKRFRCPNCSKVLSVRPAGMLDYFQSLMSTMILTIESRLSSTTWPIGIPRQRAGHWIRAFFRHQKMHARGMVPLQFLMQLKTDQVNFFNKISRTRKK